MVQIKKDKLVIELETACAKEDLHGLCTDIIEALQNTKPEMNSSNNYYFLLSLLAGIIPTPDMLK